MPVLPLKFLFSPTTAFPLPSQPFKSGKYGAWNVLSPLIGSYGTNPGPIVRRSEEDSALKAGVRIWLRPEFGGEAGVGVGNG